MTFETGWENCWYYPTLHLFSKQKRLTQCTTKFQEKRALPQPKPMVESVSLLVLAGVI